MKQLFGTDGIRGVAGGFPLDTATVSVIGASLTRLFRERLGRAPKFISGRDTRESGSEIEAAFHAGASSAGAECRSAGVITTPGVAYLAKKFDVGIVVSASHNPYSDNGIKIFLPSGMKIDETTERAIESDIHAASAAKAAAESILPADPIYRIAYSSHLFDAAREIPPNKLKIVVDCANGAASTYAPKVFRKACGEVIVINDQPDGRNINDNCGSLHLDKLRDSVLAEKADLGVAFDGDADRALFVDGDGKIVDGDATLWIMANYLKDHGKLTNSTVIATVMSNIGLELALRSREIRLLRANVGDKYVLEKLIETESEIGGEQSGHIIFPGLSLVGDGMMTALLLLRAIVERNVSLAEAFTGFTAYPQILINVKVREKRPFDDVPEIAEAAEKTESELNGCGRLLLRYSGTENLARVMIEGKDQQAIERQAEHLAMAIRRSIGQ